MLLTMGTANVTVTDAITSNPNWRRQFRKMQALLGPHSTKELTELVRSHVIGLWCEIFGISPADLNSAERLVLRYVSSGMLDILGHVEEFSPTGDVVALARGGQQSSSRACRRRSRRWTLHATATASHSDRLYYYGGTWK